MEEKSTISRNNIILSLIWRILEQFLVRGSSLVVQIVLARLLLPSDFGTVAIIVAIVHYFSVFVQSGMSAALIQKKDLLQIDIDTLFTISFGIAGFIYAIIFVISPSVSCYYKMPELCLPLRITSVILFLYSINSIQSGVLSRKMAFKTIFVRNSVVVPVSGSIGILMAYNGFGIWSLISYSILNILLAVIFMSVGTHIKMGFHFSKKSARTLYSFSIKIMGANMISGFSDLFRTMTIGKKYTTSELAFYDRAYNYSLLVQQVVNSSVQSVLLPVFSRTQDDLEHLKEMARKSIRISVFVMAPFLLGMTVIAKPLVLLLLTEKWLPCVPFFMLFLVFRLAGSIVGIDKQVYMALGKSSIFFYFELFLLAANIIMILITVSIGIEAIAIGALAVEYISSFVIVIISRKIYSYTIRERVVDLSLPVINSLIMMATMWIVNLTGLEGIMLIIAQVLTGILTYLTLSCSFHDKSLNYIITIVKNKHNRQIN
jgi:O-antigen/teichoic acid export membrane protein